MNVPSPSFTQTSEKRLPCPSFPFHIPPSYLNLPRINDPPSQEPLTHTRLPRDTALALRDLDPVLLCSSPWAHSAHTTRTGIMPDMAHATRETPHTLAPPEAALLRRPNSQALESLNFPLKPQSFGRFLLCSSLCSPCSQARFGFRDL